MTSGHGPPTIPQKELRNNIAEVRRRAGAGEEFTITVSGRPVAQLGPAAKRRWVSCPGLSAVFRTSPPETLSSTARSDPLPVDATVAREWGRLAAAVAERGAGHVDVRAVS